MIRGFKGRTAAGTRIILRRFTAPALESVHFPHRYQTFFGQRPIRRPKTPDPALQRPPAGLCVRGPNPSEAGVPNRPEYCLRLTHGNTDLWIGRRRPPAGVPVGLSARPFTCTQGSLRRTYALIRSADSRRRHFSTAIRATVTRQRMRPQLTIAKRFRKPHVSVIQGVLP